MINGTVHGSCLVAGVLVGGSGRVGWVALAQVVSCLLVNFPFFRLKEKQSEQTNPSYPSHPSTKTPVTTSLMHVMLLLLF